jgi:hypothetical protein
MPTHAGAYEDICMPEKLHAVLTFSARRPIRAVHVNVEYDRSYNPPAALLSRRITPLRTAVTISHSNDLIL